MQIDPTSPVARYRVLRDPAGWRIERGPDRLGLFANPTAAVDEACIAARRDAGQGRLAIVIAETLPREMHCYMPRNGDDAEPDGLATCLRLAANR